LRSRTGAWARASARVCPAPSSIEQRCSSGSTSPSEEELVEKAGGAAWAVMAAVPVRVSADLDRGTYAGGDERCARMQAGPCIGQVALPSALQCPPWPRARVGTVPAALAKQRHADAAEVLARHDRDGAPFL
jgi:hypothetical protein